MLGAVPGAASESTSVTTSEKKVTTMFSCINPQLPPLSILQQQPITKPYSLQVLCNYMHTFLSIYLSIKPSDNTIIVFLMSGSKLGIGKRFTPNRELSFVINLLNLSFGCVIIFNDPLPP